MNNLPLYIAITAGVLAFILAIPIAFKHFVRLAIRKANKAKEELKDIRKKIELDRQIVLTSIVLCDIFVAANLTAIAPDKNKSTEILKECDHVLALCDEKEMLIDRMVERLEKYLNTNN